MHVFRELAHLQHLHVRAEGGREGRRIGVHVVHAVVGVTEIAEFRIFEGGERGHGALIDADARGDRLLLRSGRDEKERLRRAEARVDAGKLRQGTDVVVLKLHARRRLRVVEPVERLQRDEDLRHAQIAREGEDDLRGDVGRHDDEERVEILPQRALQRGKGGIDVVGEAEVDDVHRV